MLCRCGGYLARNSAEPLFNELLKAPAGAVAREHGKVVQMQIGVAVRVGDFFIIDFTEPVVCGDGAGIGEDQAAHRIGHGGVLLYAPVGYLQITVHKPLVVQYGGTHITELFAVFTVQDICLGNLVIACSLQRFFNAVLYGFDIDRVVLHLRSKIRSYLKGKKIDHIGAVRNTGCVKCLGNGVRYTGQIKLGTSAVSLDYGVHGEPPEFFIVFIVHTPRSSAAGIYGFTAFSSASSSDFVIADIPLPSRLPESTNGWI